MAYEKLAKDIMAKMGGVENVKSVMHCYTRLRFVLHDESIADSNKSDLEKLDGVSGVVKSNGQYQIVIGSHVDDVFAALPSNSSTQPKQNAPSEVNQKFSLIDFVNGVFMPVMGVLCATGIIKGVVTLLGVLKVLDVEGVTYVSLLALGDTVLYFFPVFLGYTAMKRFGGTPFIGMVLGAAMIYPTLISLATGEPIGVLFAGSLIEVKTMGALFGVPFVAMNYSSSVFPVIIGAFLAAQIEKQVKQWMPKVLANFMIPTIVLLIIFPIVLLFIGPAVTILSTVIAQGIAGLQSFNHILAAIVVGVSWQLLIIFGLHGMLFPIIFMNLQMFGFDTIFPALFICSFTQVAACLAVVLTDKNQTRKTTAISAGISAVFGITEPAVYGVSLPSKPVFVSTVISSGIGAAIIGITGVKMYVLGGMGIFGFFNFVSPDGVSYMTQVALAVVVAMVCSFGLTWFFEKKNQTAI